MFKLLIPAVIIYAVVCIFWKRPQAHPGKIAFKICLINVVSWIIVFAVGDRGHPPPQLIVGLLLWVINFPLLIAASAALVVAFRSREENRAFLLITSIYVAGNLVLICVVPAVLLVLEA